ncbi:MAG: Eco57I restriction-modification methylase domain-containing protein [Promethearchaeia archaeon]
MNSDEQYKCHQGSIGQIFTPAYVAHFMVKNVLAFYEREKVNSPLPEQSSDLQILEPAAGEGIFLKYLHDYGFQHINAYELDSRLREELSRKYPDVHFRFKNFLGAPLDKKYDIIIGNPPYLGQNYNAEIFQEYVNQYPICEKYFAGNMDIFYYFIHLGIKKLNPGGLLSFITTNYWITKSKKTGIKFLKPHILKNCYLLQYIDLSNVKIFPKAQGQHNCIFLLKKKTVEDSLFRRDRSIKIVSIKRKRGNSTENVFQSLINRKKDPRILRYLSATTNRDLKPEKSWNLLYPTQVKKIIQQLESYCSYKGRVRYLKDFFIIRNGLIFISDKIFVLTENENIRIKDDKYLIQIGESTEKLTEKESQRIKPIYKSKEIIPYGHTSPDTRKFAIYFNKDEFEGLTSTQIDAHIKKSYPTIYHYLMQYEAKLKQTLLNAKENPNDLYFPRRGAFIRRKHKNSESRLLNLESSYESEPKIFFKYILTSNEFGFSTAPYYATSDTYFIWKKSPQLDIDYYILLAYLNSKIVRFIFKAKNIKIKRSKTKLETNLPIPSFILKKDMKSINNPRKLTILRAIRSISRLIIAITNKKGQKTQKIPDFNRKINMIMENLGKLENQNIIIPNFSKRKEDFSLSSLKKLIDQLFFALFQINEQKIDKMLRKYY